MEGTSFAPNYRYEATRDVINKGPRKLYNHHSYPADITKIENFLQSPITASGSEYDGKTNNSDVKMSDVIDVIRTDPDFTVPAKPTIRDTANRDPAVPSVDSLMYNHLPSFLNNPELLNRGQPTPVVPVQSKSGAVKKGGRGTVVRRSSVPAKPDNRDEFNRRGAESLIPRTTSELVRRHSERQQPYVKIIEQPAPKISRFRYVCESRSAGSFPGKNSTPDNPTYPTIQIVGYRGKAVVVVSCVTKNFPHKPHPFNLVSKASNEDYKKGICRLKVDTNENHGVIQFVGMGVQCVKRRGMAESLDVRRQLQVDPFGTGFSHRNQPTSIDLISVRLCFQVFIEGDTPGRFNVQLAPVVSDPVYDKRRATEPKIMKLSHCVSSVAGGTNDIILLCEKVTRTDIQIRFHEENGDWEAFADFEPAHIHKQYAICFKTPRYKTLEVKNPVKVLIQLRRPSDGATSESLPFELWPSSLLEQEPLNHKRKKTEKLMELRSLQEVAKGGRFPENFFTVDFSKPPQGGSVSSRGAPLTPQGAIANPLEGLVTSGYAPNTRGRILEKQTWNSPTYSSSQSSASPTQYWNIPRNDVLHPPKCDPKTSPEPKEIMDLDSGDLRWLMSLVEPQRHSLDTQNSLPNPNQALSLINPSADRTPNDPNLTDSLSKMALDEFYRV